MLKDAYLGGIRINKRDYHEVRVMAGLGGKSGVVTEKENTEASEVLFLDRDDGYMYVILIH